MSEKRREALTEILGYLEVYECSFCGGEEPGQHTEGCPVLELRQMVATPQTLYDWSGVDKEVIYIARDKDGKHHGYTIVPFFAYLDEWLTEGDYYELNITPNYPTEWQNSLEARPK